MTERIFGDADLKVRIFPDKRQLAAAAASDAANKIRSAIDDHGYARIIAASAASQFEFLEELTRAPRIDWKRVEMFHLDEYLGLPKTHPASFQKYLLDRLIQPTGITRYHLLDGEANPQTVIAAVSAEIQKSPIDVAFVGIGENGHLAFNDPPADFETEEAYIVVELDEACRRQQLGEGWFKTMEDVPRRALSMTIRQVLKASEILAVVPDARKAQAVASSLQGEVSPMVPASVLRRHSNTTLYLDKYSAALLQPSTLETFAEK